MGESAYTVERLDAGSLANCAEFFVAAIGLSSDMVAGVTTFLRWKYLSAHATGNVCLYLARGDEICAAVGGIVTPYVIDGNQLDVCFPVDWFSRPGNPVRAAGRKVMRALMDQFPVAVAVGGYERCFAPQIELGFRDVGDVCVLGIPGRPIKTLRQAAKRSLAAASSPIVWWRGRGLGRRGIATRDFDFGEIDSWGDELSDPGLSQLCSRGVPRATLLDKWSYFAEQPTNPARIVTMTIGGATSYALASEFSDGRKGSVALCDALVDPRHSTEIILVGMATLARLWGPFDISVMLNDQATISKATHLGYQVSHRLRTQYFAQHGAPGLAQVADFPSVSFLSLDELAPIPGSLAAFVSPRGGRGEARP